MILPSLWKLITHICWNLSPSEMAHILWSVFLPWPLSKSVTNHILSMEHVSLQINLLSVYYGLLLNFLRVKPRIHTWQPISETCLRPRMWPSSLVVSFLMKQTKNRSCIWSYQAVKGEPGPGRPLPTSDPILPPPGEHWPPSRPQLLSAGRWEREWRWWGGGASPMCMWSPLD